MPPSAVRRLTDALPAALLPVIAGVALAAALGPEPGAATGLLAGLAVTLLLILPALAVGTAVGALAGAWAGLAPFSAAGRIGRLLAGAGPLIPGFLLAAAAALAVRAGASSLPLGWAALALPAACQAATLARPAMERALGIGSAGIGTSGGGALRMAQGFGLDDRAVLRHHVLPAAVAPALGGFQNAVLAAMVGATALESLLGLPGAGGLMIDAARNGSAAGALPPLVALCGLTAFLAALGHVARDWIDRAR
ncbi:ABC transporter permease subunit [Azospirillum doebereinerae]|uniref:ABC transporter permease subunit n=1 Tax=Azospirillum doebereinerae TaxID=92933 RepID=A0A3S0X0J4_9PROT|nr:ABC transporter permease subunit [Azospirillum doebereinerae]RUQ73814.1 ABC transporter permease subunit [Azospirillum doebereinerae]